MEPLTERQIVALEALQKLHAGQTTAFLNWADADSLVDLGFAQKVRPGEYKLTLEGLKALSEITGEGHVKEHLGQ